MLKCNECELGFSPELEPGALIFSPPIQNGLVRKIHICSRCYDKWATRMMKKRLKKK
jgi:hypothetical protein